MPLLPRDGASGLPRGTQPAHPATSGRAGCSGFSRRGLFGRLFGAVAASIAAPWLSRAAAPELKFHAKAFAFNWTPAQVAFYDGPLTRMDCLYGTAHLQPDFGVRLIEKPLGARARRRQKRLARS